MTVSKIIGNQSGIQYQGVQDFSEADPRPALLNALFTGVFRHGDYNKPFKVTLADYRAKLGYDPENLYFVAIEDALNNGAPYIWVMRVEEVSGGNSNVDLISCAGATSIAHVSFSPDSSLGYRISIDGLALVMGRIESSYSKTHDGVVISVGATSEAGNGKTTIRMSNGSGRNKIIAVEAYNLGMMSQNMYVLENIEQENKAMYYSKTENGSLYAKVDICLTGLN